MITCQQATDRRYSCDNCSREMPLILKFTFSSQREKAYAQLALCEDCSAAMANLHYKVMSNDKPHQYDMDEITEVSADDIDRRELPLPRG